MKTKKGSVVHSVSDSNHASPITPPACAFTVLTIIVTSSLIASLESRIGTHNRSVPNLTPPTTCKACLACHSVRRKDFRRRVLRYLKSCRLTNMLVVVAQPLILVRWQCKVCKFTFTDYPDFRPSV